MLFYFLGTRLHSRICPSIPIFSRSRFGGTSYILTNILYAKDVVDCVPITTLYLVILINYSGIFKQRYFSIEQYALTEEKKLKQSVG